MQDQLLEVSLGKRQIDYDCSLLVYIPFEREYAIEGHGQLMLGSSQGENYLLFTLSDGSELCWTIEKPKKFAKASKDTIKFESPAESKIRTLKFEDPAKTDEVWSAICQALSDRGYTKHPGVAQSPTSERSALSQACAATAVESMSATYITPQNIDSVLSMIKNRPAAASELLRTMEQVDALRDTFQQLQLSNDRWPELVKLGELLRKVIATIDSPCQYLLISHDDNFKLVCSVLCWPDVDESLFPTSSAPKQSQQSEYLESLLAGQASTKERATIARRMALLRERVLDPTLDFPTRKSLGSLLGDHVAHILETIFHSRSMPVVSRWLARIRKGCILSLGMLKEIAGYLAARDMQVGGIGIRNSFATFFKDWRLGAYLSSVLQKARQQTSHHDQVSDSLNGGSRSEAGPICRFQGLENANYESQRVLQTLTLEILQAIAEGIPSLLWQEFSHRTISDKIPDLLEELMTQMCASGEQSTALFAQLVEQILRSTLKPQRTPAPETYGLFITRFAFLMISLKDTIRPAKCRFLVVPLLQGAVYWVESPGFKITSDQTAEMWHCLRSSTFDLLVGPDSGQASKEDVLLTWQATKTCISLLKALRDCIQKDSKRSYSKSSSALDSPENTLTSCQYADEMKMVVKSLFSKGLIKIQKVGAQRIKNGILGGIIRECVYRVIQSQEVSLVRELIPSSLDVSGCLSELLAPLRNFLHLVHDERKSCAQAAEIILKLDQKRNLVEHISLLSDESSAQIFTSLSNDTTESRFEALPLIWDEKCEESTQNSLFGEGTAQASVSNPLQVCTSYGQNASESKSQPIALVSPSVGPSTMLEEHIDGQTTNPIGSASQGQLWQQKLVKQDQNGGSLFSYPKACDEVSHLDRDVDLLDFESTEESRLESLVAQNSLSEPGLSRLGSRRASQSSPGYLQPHQDTRADPKARFISSMIPEN